MPGGTACFNCVEVHRLVVVFCLACGTVIDAALGRYQGKKSGENALARTLTEALAPGDVLLADRYFRAVPFLGENADEYRPSSG